MKLLFTIRFEIWNTTELKFKRRLTFFAPEDLRVTGIEIGILWFELLLGWRIR